MKEEFTRDQMTLWGQVNMVIGAIAITAVHFGTLLFGVPPLEWGWHGVLLLVLVPVGYLYYRQYRNTKETEK